MTKELENCPFCGKGARLIKHYSEHYNGHGKTFWHVRCKKSTCGAQGATRKTGKKAIKKWNTRAVSEKQALLNKIAEAAINESWQPIETAPRDGSKYWIKNISGNSFKVKHSPETEEENEWWEKINDITVFYSPTHWKPLNGELDKLVAEYKERFGDE